MTEAITTTRRIRRMRAFPSDGLRKLLLALEDFPALQPLIGNVLQFIVVLDASSANAEIRWRVRSRREPAARSSLHELIESGVVTAAAPFWLKTEIEEDLPEIACDLGVPLSTVLQEWALFEKLIRYIRLGSPVTTDPSCADTKDLPYIHTRDQIAADFIWTRDPHFLSTNPPNMAAGLDVTLRDYARDTSILVGVKIGSTFTIVCGYEILVEVCKGLIEGIRKIPPAIMLVVGLGIVGLLLHAKSRERLLAWLREGHALWERISPEIFALSRNAIEELAATAQAAKNAEQTVRASIPSSPRRRLSAVVVVRKVFLKAAEPLALPEIEKRVLDAGYTTRARNFARYLRTILRGNPEFAETSSGLWNLRTT